MPTTTGRPDAEGAVSSLDAELSDAETVTLTEAVNEIWGAAAMRWEVVAVFREEAVESQAWVDMVEGREPATRSAVLSVLPMENRVTGEWDAFLVRELGAAPFQGTYLGDGLLVAALTLGGGLDLGGFSLPGRRSDPARTRSDLDRPQPGVDGRAVLVLRA